MKDIRLAVISDIHVGAKARSKDLCPPHISTVAAETGYKDKFIAFLKARSLRADYLILPGDVSNIADPSEFQIASQFILEVAKTLRVKQNHIVFVPGNHDVDWSVLRPADPTGFRRKQRYAALRDKDWVFAKVIARAEASVLVPPHICTWSFEDLLVVGYNSSWKDDPNAAIHHGIIANEDLAALDQQLAKADLSPSRLRLFLVHHHPVQYQDPVDDPPDFSEMVNASSLLSILRSHKFDLLIHGHKHSPHFETHIIDSSFPMAILCSGSFSVQIDSRWSGHVNNQFHMVHIEGRDAELDNVFGRVESWAYLCGSGWIPSRPNFGISHVAPFGTYLQAGHLRTSLRPIIEAKLATKNYVLWEDIILQIPRLKYLPPDRIVETLDQLAGEVGFKRHGDPPDEVILLK